MDDYDRVMAINLKSQVGLANLALPQISARGGGAVILMSGLAGLRGNNMISAYALAKAGVAQLARNLAVEWGTAKCAGECILARLHCEGFVCSAAHQPPNSWSGVWP